MRDELFHSWLRVVLFWFAVLFLWWGIRDAHVAQAMAALGVV